MADALTGKTEIDAVAEEFVSLRVQEVLTSQMVVWPSLMDYSDQAGPGMDVIKIPRFSNFTVSTKSENTAVDAQINTMAADSLALSTYEVVQFLVEDIASLQSKVGIISAYIDQAGKDMAAKMDNVILTAFDAGVSTSSPDHAIKFNDATNEDLEKVDILEARKLLSVANVPQSERFAVIPPSQEKNLLNISEFVRVDEAGASMALRNGQIGKLFGFDVLVSTQIPSGNPTACYFYHKSAAAVARQLAPKIEQMRDLANLADRWSISHIYGVKVVDSGKRLVQITETP